MSIEKNTGNTQVYDADGEVTPVAVGEMTPAQLTVLQAAAKLYEVKDPVLSAEVQQRIDAEVEVQGGQVHAA